MIATADYQLVSEAAGWTDRPGGATVLLHGSDTIDFLQGQVTNDVEALAPGTGCYAAVLNHKGKLRTDLRVLRGADWFQLDTDQVGAAVLLHMVRTYTLGREVSVEDLSTTRPVLRLVGPAAADPLDVAPAADEHSFAEGEHGIYVRTPLGVDVFTPDLDAAVAAFGVPRVSEEAVECVRIEIGRPRLGLDMDGDTIPQEAGLNERAVSFTKGCYVGQETVARLHYRGKPNRHLRGLRLDAPAARGDEILLGDKVVGRVGSACESPRLGPIALALVRREATPGDEVLVAGTPATVAELPFSGA
ncbi:MAG: folate-binding protein YgfZ [Thermoleophilaceae bacterium]|nr:folate-binding protein YgfZ [Thermoleophilaceae bacterium]